MAKNYTFSEAVELIAKGDMEAIQDIGRRFPILATKVAAVSALAGESFVDLASYMPDYLTANKVNKGMRDALAEIEESDDDEEENDDVEETKTTKSKAKTKVEEAEEVDYNKMTAKELWDILGEAGKRNTAKSKKKADLVAAVEAMNGAEEVEEEVEEDVDEEETGNPYEGKSAMDLFKECKKRGIKAAAKKPAKFYADLLLKADAEDEGAEDEEEGDDCDAEEETPKKKPAAKAKAEKEVVEEDDEDEDDDWDI